MKHLRSFLQKWEVPEDALDELVSLIGEHSAGPPPTSTFSTRMLDSQFDSSTATMWPHDKTDSLGGSAEGSVEQTVPAVTPNEDTRDAPSVYRDLGPIGTGGMGEVRRVYHQGLDRTVAMKVIRPELLSNRAIVKRFMTEAQTTASLQHPGIVPVHETGQLPDGRLFFTMLEVQGRTLTEVIREVHIALENTQTANPKTAGPTAWTLHRLIDAFRRVCETMAYSHSQFVIHRDLKPDNIMVGTHGEVLVMDWGLAKVIENTKPLDQKNLTRAGEVIGTPTYMAPEQAFGYSGTLDERADCYSLGSILYEILTGNAPYANREETPSSTSAEVLRAVREGPPTPLSELTLPPGMESLAALTQQAMEREYEKRVITARDLANGIMAWQAGARQIERALTVLARADSMLPQVEYLQQQAQELREKGATLFEGIRPWEKEACKIEAWNHLADADALEQASALEAIAAEQLLHGALTHAPNLPAAHAALAKMYRASHERAEVEKDRKAASRAEALMRVHTLALPKTHPVRNENMDYLLGDGLLSLRCDTVGAKAQLFRYVTQNHRKTLVTERNLGLLPIENRPIAMGSYLAIISAPGHIRVHLPIHIERKQTWTAHHPTLTATHITQIPKIKDLGASDVFVPAGWFWAGGDSEAPNALPAQKVWADAFVIRKFQVTNREYLTFLNDLVDTGDEELALLSAPRERSGTNALHSSGALIYGRKDNGHFFLTADSDGDVWHPDWPVCMISYQGANAYTQWMKRRTGLDWRLPTELEWEKAARGVDGRTYPWGERFDPSRCCMASSHAEKPTLMPVDSFPIDTSPYGVRGVAGNMKEWCLDVFEIQGSSVQDGVSLIPPPPYEGGVRVTRGGSWRSRPENTRCAYRDWSRATYRGPFIGFRIARSFGATAQTD